MEARQVDNALAHTLDDLTISLVSSSTTQFLEICKKASMTGRMGTSWTTTRNPDVGKEDLVRPGRK